MTTIGRHAFQRCIGAFRFDCNKGAEMKKITAATLTILGLWAGVIAGPQAHAQIGEALEITNTTIIDMQSQAASVDFVIHYPGPWISGICGVEIRADSYNRHRPISNLLERLDITSWQGGLGLSPLAENATVLHIPVVPADSSLYLATFRIATRDGGSLAQAIEDALGPGRTVIMVPRYCAPENGCSRQLK